MTAKRSCITCNQRKIRCSKQSPCSNCVRSGVECVIPGARKHPRRVNRPKKGELLERIGELEEEVRRLKEGQSGCACTRGDPPAVADGVGYPESQFGRLVVDRGRSRYVSDAALVSLGDQIEEMQDILDPVSLKQEAHPPCMVLTRVQDGLSQDLDSLSNYHPPSPKVFALWDVFQQNVSTVVNIIHNPTVGPVILQAATHPDTLNHDSEALVFTIYFAAIVSLTPEQCLAQTNLIHIDAVQYYRVAVEKALTRANLFESQSITILQAAVIYLICLRRYDDTKYIWAMSAMVTRLAQGLGVHRDGSNFSLAPFETEMRRRLWWHICVLDFLTAEDHGTAMLIRQGMYDARLPLNVDNGDIAPGMDAFPTEREGFTDMTQCLVHCEIIVAFQRMQHKNSSLDELNHHLEDCYFKHFDLNSPRHWVAATTARLALARSWLLLNFPASSSNTSSISPPPDSSRLFQTATQILQFAYLLEINENTTNWHWLFKTYKQWHALAYLLSELCSRPVTPETDKAWIAASSLYRQWERDATTTKAPLWRPLSRLMEKAVLSRRE
ncbi:hypothetical protein ASPWEDRAFT_25950 [Aspergillus wentii DTO 134E9]|uniref:Zn(2)-C6 fungal-type domain-containing protein n=1 Tax=Aspergillus wentii DTO 134E9 TaxID=1073089 RepID=A0A1L9RNG5_ASPWE|nr:uncharacterized protein ASPWEDRAFT_25950 [Aspergillus wentii DTO 134E9]KAI9934370.1 hypothetical protein MW887_005447 [Aspergillus wentii]OJJ36485.1 hypothetical protein ASPWEDRAFT_25950 [Aspergillus wentii DTO 134E9]